MRSGKQFNIVFKTAELMEQVIKDSRFMCSRDPRRPKRRTEKHLKPVFRDSGKHLPRVDPFRVALAMGTASCFYLDAIKSFNKDTMTLADDIVLMEDVKDTYTVFKRSDDQIVGFVLKEDVSKIVQGDENS